MDCIINEWPIKAYYGPQQNLYLNILSDTNSVSFPFCSVFAPSCDGTKTEQDGWS